MGDLWRYNVSNNEWTWLQGSSEPESLGPQMSKHVYGGYALESRAGSSMTLDEESNVIYMLGGWNARIDENTSPFAVRNALFVYSIAVNQWAFLSGDADDYLVGQAQMGYSRYGTKLQSGSKNVPGSRMRHALVHNKLTGHINLYGGNGWTNAVDTRWVGGVMSALWVYEPYCVPGTYSVASRGPPCRNCSPGSISQWGKQSCEQCAAGEQSINSVTCSNCTAGRYSGEGSAECTLCPLGTGTDPLQSRCLPCSEGYAAATGMCMPCSPGRFSNASRMSRCLECGSDAGSLEGKSACAICVPGKFKSSLGECACNSSHPGYGSVENSQRERGCYCKEGYYGKVFGGGVCTKCSGSAGVSCPENSTIPFVARGYFRNPDDPSLAYKCFPDEACLLTEWLEQTVCAEGYTGYLCGTCAQGSHFRLGEECRKCSFWMLFNFLYFFMFVMAVLFLLLRTSVPTYKKIYTITISLFWMQLLDLVAEQVDEWPRLINWLVVLASSLNFNIDLLSPECSFDVSYWMKWHTKMCSPLILGSLQLLYFSLQEFNIHKFSLFDVPVSSLYKRIFKDKKIRYADKYVIKQHFPYRRTRYVYGYGVLIYSLYTLLCSTAMEMFKCARQSDGNFLMVKYSSQLCFDPYWTQILFTNVVFSGYTVVGIPFGLFLRLRDNRAKPEFKANFGSFVAPYKDSRYWWPVYELVHRFLIVFALEIVSFHDRKNGLLAVIILIFSYDVMLIYFKPFTRSINSSVSIAYVPATPR